MVAKHLLITFSIYNPCLQNYHTMNLLSTLTLVLIMIFAYISHGQSTYNYKDYEYPDIKIRGLNLSAQSFGTTSGSTEDRFAIGSNINYFSFLNTDQKQVTNLITTNINFKNETRQEGSVRLGNDVFNFAASKRQINRKYIHNNTNSSGYKGKFFEINHQVDVEFANNQFKPWLNQNIDIFTTGAHLPIAIGIGRVEPTREIFTAQFLMDDLIEEGILKERLSENQLFDLAQLMAKVSNQRIFDFRRAYKYQLSEIAKWFESQNIPLAIETFTAIADNWANALTNQRLEGKRLTMGITPGVDFTQASYSEKYSAVNYNFDIFIKRESFKNINQYFNRELTYFVSYFRNVNKNYFNGNSNGNINNQSINLGMHTTFAYNPNSRTTYAISPSLSTHFVDFNSLEILISAPLSLNYFINHNTRIQFNLQPTLKTGANVSFYSNWNGTFLEQEFNPNFRSYGQGNNGFTRPLNIKDGYSLTGGLTFIHNFF